MIASWKNDTARRTACACAVGSLISGLVTTITPSRFAAAERSDVTPEVSTMCWRLSSACALVVGRSVHASPESAPTRLYHQS